MFGVLSGDPYAVWVIGAYAAAAAVLGATVWQTLSANARARRELAREERGGDEG